MKILGVSFSAFIAASLPLLGSLTVDNFSANTNDRFANDGSYLLDGINLTGIGRVSRTISAGNLSQAWATLVSPNVFVTANHTAIPGALTTIQVGDTVTFYPGNDPTATPVTRTVSSLTTMGGSDLIAGVLNADVPASISPLSYVTETISTLSGSQVSLQNAYVTGNSQTTALEAPLYGGGDSLTNQTNGRNTIDFYGSLSPGGIVNDSDFIATVRHLPGDTNYQTNETFLNPGESGAPLLIDDGMGGVLIAGTNSFTATNVLTGNFDGIAGTETRDASFYTYIGNYSDTLDTFITTNAIPEPSTNLILLAAPLAFVWRRRRSA